MCRPLSCMYHCREIERESNPTSHWFSHWNVYNEADIFASAVSSVLMNPHTEIWKTRVNRPCKSSKIQNAVHLRLQQSKVLELSCHKRLFKKTKLQIVLPPTETQSHLISHRILSLVLIVWRIDFSFPPCCLQLQWDESHQISLHQTSSS